MNNKEYFEKLSSYPPEYKFYVQHGEKIDFVHDMPTVGDMINYIRDVIIKDLDLEGKIYVDNKEATLKEKTINGEKAVLLYVF